MATDHAMVLAQAEERWREQLRREDELAALSAHLAAATARWVELAWEFFENVDSDDPAGFLAYRFGVTRREACEYLRVAEALRELPEARAAFARGELSFSKVRALTRVATASSEKGLLELAGALTASQLERALRVYRRVARTRLVVHVDAAALSSDRHGRYELEDGPVISPETARRLGCDAELVAQVERDGLPLSAGRRRRTVPPALRPLLEARDGETCCFPGCERRRHLQAHHCRHWAHGGETSLANLVLLCLHHHRFVHEGGYTVEDDPAGSVRFRNRYGVLSPNATQTAAREPGGASCRERPVGAHDRPEDEPERRLQPIRPRLRGLRYLERDGGARSGSVGRQVSDFESDTCVVPGAESETELTPAIPPGWPSWLRALAPSSARSRPPSRAGEGRRST